MLHVASVCTSCCMLLDVARTWRKCHEFKRLTQKQKTRLDLLKWRWTSSYKYPSMQKEHGNNINYYSMHYLQINLVILCLASKFSFYKYTCTCIQDNILWRLPKENIQVWACPANVRSKLYFYTFKRPMYTANFKRYILKTLFIWSWLERKTKQNTYKKKNNQKYENQ